MSYIPDKISKSNKKSKKTEWGLSSLLGASKQENEEEKELVVDEKTLNTELEIENCDKECNEKDCCKEETVFTRIPIEVEDTKEVEHVKDAKEEQEEEEKKVEESDRCYVKQDENGNWNATIVPVKEEVEENQPLENQPLEKVEPKIEEKAEVRLDLSEDPGVYTIENYVTDEECEHMKNLAIPNLERSVVSDGKGGYKSPGRTSKTAWINHDHDEITTRIGNKIANLVGIPIERSEKFQVVYYGETHEYRSHYDSWEHDNSEKTLRCMKYGGQRLLTALVYLNTPEEGGSTAFPRMKKEVKAEKGKLLVFENVYKNTVNKHHLSEHAGMPVIKGEKYIFNLWFRECPRTMLYKDFNPSYYEMKGVPDLPTKILDKTELKRIDTEKGIYKKESFLEEGEVELIMGEAKFSTSKFPGAWVKKENHPKLVKRLESLLEVDSEFFENMNVIKYSKSQVHGPFNDSYDMLLESSKKYTSRLGNRVQTISICLKGALKYSFDKIKTETYMKEGTLIFYDNVMKTHQRDENMVHTIRHLGNQDVYLMNVYVREKSLIGKPIIKTVFELDVDEINKSVEENKLETLPEELLLAENIKIETSEVKLPPEDHIASYETTLKMFADGNIDKSWGGYKSFKYAFRGDFDYFKEKVLKIKELRENGGGLRPEHLEKEYEFDEFHPVVVEKSIGDEMIQLVKTYYREQIEGGVFILGDRQAHRYRQHNEQLSRFLHYEILPVIEKITKKKLRPTYTYLSSYINGSDLPAHTDRPDCEFTVSYLAGKDADWPIYAHLEKQPVKNKGRYDFTPPKSECVELNSDEGGFIIFQGTDHIHFREAYTGGFYDILLLHYRIDE